MTRVATRRRRRTVRGQRGVAMFVVMMLLMMVSAAGVFVTRSSSLEIRSSGYVRQSAQTHYVAEAGASAVMTRLRSACAAYFSSNLRVRAMSSTLPGCPAITTSRGPITPPCYTFYLDDFAVITTPQLMFPGATGTGTARTAGSFGAGGMTPRFQVRVTELGADTSPQRGTDVSDPSLLALPVRLLVESEGMTELDSALYGTDTTNIARGTESLRAITVIPCN